MSLDKKNLTFAFIGILLLTVFSPALLPTFRLLYFSPFLILVYYQKPYSSSLWISIACGLILDLLASNVRFGLYALNFAMTAAIIYKQRWNFFADSFSTLPIMTFLFSFTSTVIQALLFYIFAKPIPLSLAWVFTDLLAFPALDAIFAVVWFLILPSLSQFFFFNLSSRLGRL